ncbi:peptidoglycan DD-metalloendopeptidase family protein [Pseudenhygromyxa sp. WMMC2535]|uniref:murein hydrolase activator EnvC family protein n=1 Tax=Pseudenhygromyxa sp. WMMC2535 TaxID=2712867 RepID=UPI001556B75E|nr:peptidoglycan DD-metalloendopeptidase family protein [Pseudenhygromyxa sp. WMMC2535]NVB38049.1 peptidoglycan DD-metalloendopeptidase family protein [Pseudenhygromyxa sp. WMMC2535]
MASRRLFARLTRGAAAGLLGLSLLGVLADDASAGVPLSKRRELLRHAAERELELTEAANELERAKVARERERESLSWAGELLEHRANESLRELDVYRARRSEREAVGAVRARKLYKLARGGGVLEMMFEDGADGRSTPQQRAARGRTLRQLVDRDLEQLRIHGQAEQRARAELLTASRELAVLSTLDSLARMQDRSLDAGDASLHPRLAAAHSERRRLQRRLRGQAKKAERELLGELHRERRDLLRRRGLDLLEEDTLVRPVDGRVVGDFGDYEDPLTKIGMHRNGVELRARAEDEVRVIAPGEVRFVGALPGYERVVVVDHGGGYLSLTARLLSVHVEEGQELEAGDALGRVGPKAVEDGLGTTAYVEIRHGARPIDPEPYLRPRKRGGRRRG